MRRHHSRAFTLVELLVVIGIIALLISILLPSLNRARQAGNLVDCQARLQQMGQAVQIYISQSKGMLPWSSINHTAWWTDNALPNPSNQQEIWYWMFTLSEVMGRNPLASDGLVRNLSPMFRDRDTIEPTGQVPWVNHYTANPRVMYRADIQDEAPNIFSGAPTIDPNNLTQRKITSVRRPSDVFIIWDGPQAQNWSPAAIAPNEFNTYPVAEALDGWGWYSVSALCADAPNTNFQKNITRPINPGYLGNATSSTPSGKAFQKKYNYDPKFAFGSGQGWLSHLRFRHMNNTRLAALCLDGHVETREVGTVMVRDIMTNFR